MQTVQIVTQDILSKMIQQQPQSHQSYKPVDNNTIVINQSDSQISQQQV